ncbi:MAG: HAD family hydrolase [Oscillospiraceae bacterium]
MLQAVIFDLDGTLLDTLADLASAGNHTLSAMGLPTHPVAAYREFVGGGISRLIQHILPATHQGESTRQLALTLFSRHYQAHMFDATAPYPGILPLLAWLRTQPLFLGVLSNKDDAFTREIVERYFPGTFHAVAGLQEGFAPKPDPAALHVLLQALAVPPQRTLYVGDKDVDIFTAQNAGTLACAVSWGFQSEDALRAAGAPQLAQNPEQLAQLVQALLEAPE